HEEGPTLFDQPIQFGDRHLIEFLGFGAAALIPASPTGVVQVRVKTPRTGVSCEANTGGAVAKVAHDFGDRLDFGPQPTLVSQRDDLRPEAVHPGQHGGVGRGGGDVRAVGVLKQDTLGGEVRDVGRRQAGIAVTTHVVSAQGVNGNQQNIGSFIHCPKSSLSSLECAAISPAMQPCSTALDYNTDKLINANACVPSKSQLYCKRKRLRYSRNGSYCH